MRIIMGELKKIWNIKMLAIIAALCVLYFVAVMSFWVGDAYPRGQWFGNVDFAHHLTEQYGASLSLDDFEDFLNYRDVISAEMDLFITSRPIFVEAGIYNFRAYEDFLRDSNLRYETLTEEERNLRYSLLLELGYIVRTEFASENGMVDLSSDNETPVAYLRIRAFDTVVGMYQSNIIGDELRSGISFFLENRSLSNQERARLIEIENSGELTNIMPQHTILYTWEYGQQLAILVILAILILTSTLITADRANKVNWLQYSSKQGRNILKKQFAAVIISAVGITTMLVAAFGGIFVVFNETYILWNNGINSFMGFPFHWFSITYGQYVLLIVGIIYAISIGVATLAFVLSRFSQNMVSLLFKVIPFFVVSLMMSNWILDEFLGIYVGGNLAVQMISLAFSLLVGMIIAIFVLQRERTVELV